MTFRRPEGPHFKQPKSAANPAYLEAVRQLPCVICVNFGGPGGQSHAHHTICGRYSQVKTPDEQAIPLCHLHHQGADGIHSGQETWVSKYGPDTDFIAQTQDRLAHLMRGK